MGGISSVLRTIALEYTRMEEQTEPEPEPWVKVNHLGRTKLEWMATRARETHD